MSRVDYTKYSLLELYEALESIDAAAFPENYENLMAELAKPERNNEQTLSEHKERNEAELIIFKRVIWIFVALMMFVASAVMHIEGVIKARGGRVIVTLDDNPIGFHLGILAFICLGIYSIYIGVFGDLKTKKRI
ncbi:hypothetical protein [Alkalimonas sp.]|uniref:hypothetical protein n=1 Tax=Alkalimonas sp. TaxID=1872453 RepID=UPI00263AD450|nr:hypothetical protein [Alkalimonas sp.]MCC5825163.1 hypothetical protein [Alkalimonas sp.]